MLAIVSGIVVSGGVNLLNILAIVVLAVLCLAGVLFLGPYLLRFTIRLLCHLDLVEAKMFTSYLFVMVLAWLANLVGLATIIGAFAAGFVNPYASGYSSDVVACWLIMAIWVIYEATSKAVRHGWICLLLGVIPGVAVGFSLYLVVRSVQLREEPSAPR